MSAASPTPKQKQSAVHMTMPMMRPANDQNQNRRVRQRITLACNGCRLKRTKCDGQQPQCSACKYRNEPCEYTQAESKRKRPSKQYVESLEARLACLEERLAIRSIAPRGSSGESGTVSLEIQEQSATSSIPRSSTLKTALAGKPAATETVDELTDILGSFTLGDAGELRYFGAASNFSFNRNLSFKETSAISARMLGIESARQLNGLEISDDLRDHLLGLYWRWQNSWQYLVPQESFLHDLHIEKSGRFCTPLLLTAMLAYASRYSDRLELRTDPTDPNTAGMMLYTQAKTMLHCEFEAPTTSTVQAAGLLSLYSAAMDRESLGWLYVGIASRIAINLGLHSDCSEYVRKGILSPEDADARNVAWWGIYVLDRLFGLGYGRPGCIQECNMSAPKPSTSRDNISPWPPSIKTRCTPSFSSGHISINSIYTCELFNITSEVHDQLYSRRPGWTISEREDRIMQTHLRLVEFYDRLPKILKISTSSLKPALPHVYQLHIQFHVAMLLLHRPFARGFRRKPSGEIDEPEREDDQEDIHTASCRVSAEKMANIFRIYHSNYNLRHIPISAVHSAVTAAIIHLVNVRRQGSQSQSKAMHCLKILIKSLYDMNVTWNWSNRSIRSIESLAEEWKVDIWGTGLAKEIDPASLLSFQRYKGEIPVEQRHGTDAEPTGYGTGENSFEAAWTSDPNFNFLGVGLEPTYSSGNDWLDSIC